MGCQLEVRYIQHTLNTSFYSPKKSLIMMRLEVAGSKIRKGSDHKVCGKVHI